MNNKKGFTLVELIVSISIIALLSTIGISTYSSIQQNTRNTKRKADLQEMKTALEQYRAANGSYPCSGNNGSCASITWLGLCSAYGSKPDSGPDGYIPGLAPEHMAKLPHDPRENKLGSCGAGSETSSCYLYRSDGADYKLLAHCTPEGTMNANDAFYDPCRPTWSWQISSSRLARGEEGRTCSANQTDPGW